MKILSSRRFALWWQLAMDWFQRQFAAIAASIDFTPVEEKTDELLVHSLTHTQNNYQAGNSQINRIVVNYIWLGLTNTCKNYDLIGTETVGGILYYKWATANEMPVEYVYTTKWKDLTEQGGDAVYVKNGDVMERLTNPQGFYVNTWQAQSMKTATKIDVATETRNVAGSCIIPDFELPCLPFVPEGFCAIYGDADYVIGDFAPQTEAEQLEVGSIIHVTGNNATEEEFEGYPEGSLMAVAKTTLEPTGYTEGLYQDSECHMQGITEEILWQKGGYYRVTGIIECYSELTSDNITIFTYEEIEPATITDMGKKIVEKLDELDVHDENAKHLAQFFGLPQALPQFTYATEQEVKDINDDVMGALYGYGKVTVTIHSLMRTGAETTQDLASVIYVDPEKTWAENGFQTLYDDEGTAIDTTTNPAAGDEVFNYQIQSES